jgi:hypothetical protein
MRIMRSESSWWFGAFFLPVVAIVTGLLFAYVARLAPADSNDWMGMRILLPAMLGILCGCLLSCVAALVSFAKRERLAGWSLIPSIPSFIFVVWVGNGFIRAQMAMRQQKDEAAIHRAVKDERISACEKRIRSNPDLITSDVFWLNNMAPDSDEKVALIHLINDYSFEISSRTKESILRRFPDRWLNLAQRKLLTKEELSGIAADQHRLAYDRESARRFLEVGQFTEVKLPNQSTDPTP